MPISRRKFIEKGTLVALAAGVPLKVAARDLLPDTLLESTVSNPEMDNASQLDLQAFVGCLDTEFRIVTGYSTVVTTRLVKVYDLISKLSIKTRNVSRKESFSSKECFTAVFRAPAGATQLRQGTYEVEHETLGTFSLFLVPGSTSANSSSYDAIFNRL